MSNVIKRDFTESYRSAVVLDLGDIETQAARIVAEAQARAASIVNGAQEAAVGIRRLAGTEGRKDGLETGREEGLKAGRDEGHREALDRSCEEISRAAGGLTAACAEFDALKENLFKQAETDLLKLAVMIARKITNKEIAVDSHITAENVRRCLDLLSQRRNLVVRVAPGALPVVEESMPEISKRLGDLSSVKIVADEEVAPGGCLIMGESGMIDATIESQFAEAERILFGEANA